MVQFNKEMSFLDGSDNLSFGEVKEENEKVLPKVHCVCNGMYDPYFCCAVLICLGGCNRAVCEANSDRNPLNRRILQTSVCE